MKQILSIISIITLVIGILPLQPFAVSAAAMSGDGSAANPYIIVTMEQLNAVRDDLTAHYQLGADIDASETASWNNGSGFEPIGGNGNDASQFIGAFDGAGHVIRGLTINRPSTDLVGLFGIIGSGGIIKNVGLTEGSIVGKLYTGGLAGRNLGMVDRSFATGSVSSSEGIVGGLVGYGGIDSTLSISYATGAVDGLTYVGGLVGRNDGLVIDSHASGAVSGTDIVGGLAGDNEGAEIRRSYATGTVHGSGASVGGLVGYNVSSILTHSYATGSVSGHTHVGGLVGRAAFGMVSQSYATGEVSGQTTVGGLIGHNNWGDLSNSFWDQETSGQSSACGYNNEGYPVVACADAGLTIAQALTQSSYSGWDFSDVWFMVDGSTRPFLRSEWSQEIRNTHQLQLMAMDLSAHYELARDIDFATVFTDNSRSDMWATRPGAGAGFAPIGGDYNALFTGKLEGSHHIIRNLAIDRPGTDFVGLFKYFGNGSLVRDVGLEGGDVKGASNTGVLVGENRGGTIENVYAAVDVSGASNVGGLVGQNYVGGSVSQAYATGDITGQVSVGGLVGRNEMGMLNDAYATGSVNASSEVGGLVGRNVGHISRAYAAGRVMATDINVGGLVGRNFVDDISGFYDSQSSGQGDADKGTPKTTAEMKQRATFEAEWDFNDIWIIEDGRAYPTLRGIVSNLGSDVAPPTIVRAVIEPEHPDHVLVTFDEEVRIWWAEGVSIKSDAVNATIVNIEGNGTKTLTFIVSAALEQRTEVTLSYDDQSGSIADLAGNSMSRVAGQTVYKLPLIEIVMKKSDNSDYEDGTWTNQSVTVSATAADEVSVTSFVYSQNNGETWSDYVSDIVLQEEGIYGITFKAINAGGLESVEHRTVKISRSGLMLTPTLVKADGSAYTSGDWTNQSVTVSVYAESGASEMVSLIYTSDGGTEQQYANGMPIEILEEGTHALSFQVRDEAGNTLSENLMVKIDKTLPSVDFEPGGNEVVSTSAAAKIMVSDNGSNVDASSLNYAWTTDTSAPDAGWKSFVNGAALPKSGVDGDWYLHIKASDLAGNETSAVSERFRLTRQIDSGSGSSTRYTSVQPMSSNVYPIGLNGRTIRFEGGQIVIPAGAMDRVFHLTIDEITDKSVLPFSSGQQLVSRVIEFTKDQAGKFDKEVTISLSLNAESMRREDVEVNLYWLNEEDGQWVVLDNRQVDGEKGIVSGTTNHFTKFAIIATPVKEEEPEPAAHFTDIRGHWAEASILKMAEKGTVSGYVDGSFMPNSPITRAEFTAILVHALGLTEQEGKTFTDMTTHWARQDVSTAYAYGIIHGYDADTFVPDALITREQMAVMLMNALQWESSPVGRTFTDQSEISIWAQSAFAAVVENGIMTGYADNSIKPQAYATRAEAVATISRSLEKYSE